MKSNSFIYHLQYIGYDKNLNTLFKSYKNLDGTVRSAILVIRVESINGKDVYYVIKDECGEYDRYDGMTKKEFEKYKLKFKLQQL